MGLLNKIKSLFNKESEEPKKSDEEWKPAYESNYEGVIGHFNLDNWWENKRGDEIGSCRKRKKPDC